MVALCPTHHREMGKQSRKDAYRAKQNPLNIRKKRFNGYLVTNKEDSEQSLILGNTLFIGVSTAVSFYGVPLFGSRFREGKILVNCFIPDASFFPEIEIKDNNVSTEVDRFWDINFKSNYVIFKKQQSEVFIAFDFRKENVVVRGRVNVLGRMFEFSQSKSDFGGSRIEGLILRGRPGQTAISHGESGTRLLQPNYAMASPGPFLYREQDGRLARFCDW